MSQLMMRFETATSPEQFLAPAGYSGLYGFHKYWGKKPPETMSFLLEQLSQEDDVVFDPFLGSGAVARESFMRNRRFVGCDINPSAVEIALLSLIPPRAADVELAFSRVEAAVRAEIESQYQLKNGAIASHYLWDEDKLACVWTKPPGQRTRVEFAPTKHDLMTSASFAGYEPHDLRPLRIFQNSRINARSGMGWHDLFTDRAIRSIELLRSAILGLEDDDSRRALLLGLTAAVGQMSKMVFAIERRGKSGGNSRKSRIEVGSWVIGLWTPKLRFEVNAWNCFANKVTKLLRGLHGHVGSSRCAHVCRNPRDVAVQSQSAAILCRDAIEVASELPQGSVNLLLTDPPHGDRIPYLEMSEIWNAILGHAPDFQQELVVSNARERNKDMRAYSEQLTDMFDAIVPALANDATVAVLFNSRSEQEWETLLGSLHSAGLAYRGRVPMAYSAGSVVQDNRKGSLAHDYVVVFSRRAYRRIPSCVRRLAKMLPGWSAAVPSA